MFLEWVFTKASTSKWYFSCSCYHKCQSIFQQPLPHQGPPHRQQALPLANDVPATPPTNLSRCIHSLCKSHWLHCYSLYLYVRSLFFSHICESLLVPMILQVIHYTRHVVSVWHQRLWQLPIIIIIINNNNNNNNINNNANVIIVNNWWPSRTSSPILHLFYITSPDSLMKAAHSGKISGGLLS